MSELYKRIKSLCDTRNINITQLCRDSGASRGSLSDLKMGRKQRLSTETLSKIANYFNVSVDYLLGKTEEKTPSKHGERRINDDDIKFALFDGDKDITDAQYEEVKRFAAYVKERDKNK